MPEQRVRRRIQLYVLTIAVAAIPAGACAGGPAPGGGEDTTPIEAASVSTRPADTPSTSAEPTPPSSAAVDPCRLLEDAELRDLAGTQLPAPTQTTFAGIPQCRWGAPGDAVVQVQAAPSAEWAVSAEDIIDQLAANPNSLLTTREKLNRHKENCPNAES